MIYECNIVYLRLLYPSSYFFRNVSLHNLEKPLNYVVILQYGGNCSFIHISSFFFSPIHWYYLDLFNLELIYLDKGYLQETLAIPHPYWTWELDTVSIGLTSLSLYFNGRSTNTCRLSFFRFFNQKSNHLRFSLIYSTKFSRRSTDR